MALSAAGASSWVVKPPIDADPLSTHPPARFWSHSGVEAVGGFSSIGDAAVIGVHRGFGGGEAFQEPFIGGFSGAFRPQAPDSSCQSVNMV
jgi:hypothetical protein